LLREKLAVAALNPNLAPELVFPKAGSGIALG
jgi:hypothetical protein